MSRGHKPAASLYKLTLNFYAHENKFFSLSARRRVTNLTFLVTSASDGNLESASFHVNAWTNYTMRYYPNIAWRSEHKGEAPIEINIISFHRRAKHVV